MFSKPAYIFKRVSTCNKYFFFFTVSANYDPSSLLQNIFLNDEIFENANQTLVERERERKEIEDNDL